MKTFFLFLFSFLFLSTGILLAQPADIPYHIESYELESGFYNGSNQAGNTVEVFSGIVRVDEFPWMQLHFSKANLGSESYIIITSLKDGKWQKLDAVTIEQWNNYSAFFNGDAVEIQLFAASFDKDVFVNIDEITVGDWAGGSPYTSICGPTDDRISSNQPATGRLMNIGCTAWIIPNGKFVSAGHCLDGSGATIMEFQVPPSLPSGTVQHPGPEDQYSVDVSTKIFTNGGVGNDWGVFEVFPNSVTSLMPKEAQGAYWPLVQDLGPDSIRITGYGVDGGVANQTQQTHIGPNAGSSGTTMRYVTDTQGGNSGSPVINGLTGEAVGVHTHGGCNSSGGNNNGTSTFHAAFWAAVDEGAGGCLVEPPSNPTPANSTTGVSLNLAELSWTNGAGAVINELYFGSDPGTLSLVQSGSLATSWTITVGPFEYSTTYYWQVVEIGDTCNTNGSVWNFTTVPDPSITTVFYEDFDGSWPGTWTMTNNGGTCEWIIAPDGTARYGTPGASGNLLIADSDLCGSGTTMNTTATMDQGADLTGHTDAVLYFAHDYNDLGAADVATVEYSIDGGSTWTLLVTFDGADIVEIWDSGPMPVWDGQADLRFRFTYVAGWDWWWAIDNIFIDALVPVELTSFTASVNENNVTLNWVTASEINNLGFEVQRKTADEFSVVGFINGNGTTTERHSYMFIDEDMEAGQYTYRLKQLDLDGTFEYSDVIEVDITVPDVFALEQNYPNPFNPSTKINFSLAVDSKVSLKVFDVLGQEVVTLISSDLVAGTHNVNFSAASMNSGVYFYRIEATGIDGTNFTSVKKMLLTK